MSWHKGLRKEFCGENPKSSRFVNFKQLLILEWGAGMAPWGKHSPPATVAGFSSRIRRHMWVEFIGGSGPCSKCFSLGYLVFLPP